ncbi:hypothetical protein RHMOL_Rhmol13G0238900 [Rhododendron molle]|uniref:Uncharacterized protein n=1 Tax=Rhododendron molle TaxID=49168 RepID=A0ACC0LBM5_RHOML|nr:hypothetical protein RHMOL_Rhmol13G0238900 [Rhododendron molle]
MSGPVGTSVARAFRRTVTNVGPPGSTYRATVVAPPGLEVEVEPGAVSFQAVGQRQAFVLKVSGVVGGGVASGYLVWDDGVSQVRSPIVAHSSA